MAILKIPGLIDAHVHLRDPGQTQKEDFLSGTTAALFGGFTTVLDMPNNSMPITTEKRLLEKRKIAKKNTVCDIGFYFGSLGDNLDQFPLIYNQVFGLKLYLNQTTGNFIIGEKELADIFFHWRSDKPILIHGEESMLEKVFAVVRKTGRRTHICHISSKFELQKIIDAKNDGLPVTCGVTAHHLYLTEKDVNKLGNYAMVKPPIKKKSDREFLWKNIGYIDIIESDHAPHTIKEKNSPYPPFGLPGLETTLPLLLTSLSKSELTLQNIVRMCYENPAKIFRIPKNTNTYIEIDDKSGYVIDNKQLKTKCGWTPFAGWKVYGRIRKIVMKGKKVMENGRLLVRPGSGKIIKSLN